MAQHSKKSGWSPFFWLAAGIAGGLLLARYWRNMPAITPTTTNNEYDPLQMPSSRLGAREEQMTSPDAQHEQPAATTDDAGTTAAAFDLDPQSVTPG